MKRLTILVSSVFALLIGCAVAIYLFADQDEMEIRQAQETADRVNGNDFILMSFRHNGAGSDFHFRAQWDGRLLDLRVPETHSRYDDFCSLKRGDHIGLKRTEKETFVRASFVAAYPKPEGGPLKK